MTGIGKQFILLVDDNLENELYELFLLVLPPNFKLLQSQSLGHASIVMKNEPIALVLINMTSTRGSTFDFIKRSVCVHPQTQFAVLVPENFEGFELMQKSKHVLKISRLARLPKNAVEALELINRSLVKLPE